MDKKYIDYLFEDEESGEMFFVEIEKTKSKTDSDCYDEAWTIAQDNFDSPIFVEEVDPIVAESYGYDTY